MYVISEDLCQYVNREFVNSTNEQFETIDVYLLVSQKLLSVMLPKTCSYLATSEDAISNVATALMFADYFWNGNGSKFGYRKRCAKWAIKNLVRNVLSQERRNHKFKINSLPDTKDIQNRKIIEDNEHLLKLFDSAYFSERERDCLKYYYLDDLTTTEVGEKMNLAHQTVSYHLWNAEQKIRELHKQKRTRETGGSTCN